MENERAEYVFGLLEQAAVNEQRCPINPEIAALLQKRGYRAAAGTIPGLTRILVRQGRIVIRVYGTNWRQVVILAGTHEGKSTKGPPHGGNPFTATGIMFAIAMAVALGLRLPVYGVPTTAQLGSAPLVSYAAGLLIGFYALSATIIIPRFGAANFVAFILIAQLLTSAAVDQFGLFSMAKRPIDSARLIGLIVIVARIAIMEIGSLRKTH